jgi:hypothetical protein
LALAAATMLGAVVVRALATQRLGRRSKGALAFASLALLVTLTASDWPSETLNSFWADHSILTSVLTTVLLLGAGWLAIDLRGEHLALEVDDSVTGAGLGGLVEALADIDFALTALLTAPGVARHRTDGKPLRWVRLWRDQQDLGTHPLQDAGPLTRPGDKAGNPEWRELAQDVVNECLRRLSGGLRDWAPLLTHTRDGSASLVRAARIRLLLMDIEDLDPTAERAAAIDAVWDRIRAECRLLALGFELASGASRPRSYLTSTGDDLLDPSARELFEQVSSELPTSGGSKVERQEARRIYLTTREFTLPARATEPSDVLSRPRSG